LQGQKDCAEGKPHQMGMPDSYNRGYSAQYQHEQNMNHLDEVRHGNCS
jgi:hypothetical protein